VGVNTNLAIALAVEKRAGAAYVKVPLLYHYLAELDGKRTDMFITPVPSLNIFNTRAHAGNSLEIQEFMILPTGTSHLRKQLESEMKHTITLLNS
jgi:enolase